MSDHAFLPPSGASIWGPDGCPYYPTIAAAYPQTEDDPEAREGTAAHHYLSERLLGRTIKVGDFAPNGEIITEEMAECTQIAIDYVATMLPKLDRPPCVEQRVAMPSIHPTLNWGTSDWFGCNVSSRTIWIMDYKHGHGYVDPWENWQLVDYGVGVARHFGIEIDGTWRMVFAIVQPRAYHPSGPLKEWECFGGRFTALTERLATAAAEATGPDPEMRTGDHCRYCQGRAHCAAYQRVVGDSLDVAQQGVPQEMNPAAVGTMRTQIHTAIKRLEAMATGLDAQIDSMTRKGQRVPGWELKPKDTRLVWSKPIPEVHALGDLLGVDLRKNDAVTPTQAVKLGIDEAVISEYAKRPPGGMKVSPSDKDSAAKAFK